MNNQSQSSCARPPSVDSTGGTGIRGPEFPQRLQNPCTVTVPIWCTQTVTECGWSRAYNVWHICGPPFLQRSWPRSRSQSLSRSRYICFCKTKTQIVKDQTKTLCPGTVRRSFRWLWSWESKPPSVFEYERFNTRLLPSIRLLLWGVVV